MAPLPSNSTAVLFVDYSTSGENHTIQTRFGAGGSIADALTLVADLLDAVAASFKLITIIGARVRDAGGSVTYPVTWTGAATYGSGTGAHNQSAAYFDFVGRTIGGRRCRISIFGCAVDSDSTNEDYRLTAAESGTVADGLVVLRAGNDVPVGIDGDVVNWYDYANIGQNAYWRNHIRG